MARRSMTGQLNMFDLFNSMDPIEPGEVEMVSLVPDFEEEPLLVVIPEATAEPEVEELPEVEEEKLLVRNEQTEENVAMSRSYVLSGKKIEIAYINYNKVRITRGDEAPIIKEFASTKEAVDYYVEQMQELVEDEEV